MGEKMAEQLAGYLSKHKFQKLVVNAIAPPAPLPILTQFHV